LFNPLRGVVLATACGSITPNIGGSITAVSDTGDASTTARFGYAKRAPLNLGVKEQHATQAFPRNASIAYVGTG
jgi:hypothetical protein